MAKSEQLAEALAAARAEDEAADRAANLRAAAAAAGPFWASVPATRPSWVAIDAAAVEEADMRAEIERLAARVLPNEDVVGISESCVVVTVDGDQVYVCDDGTLEGLTAAGHDVRIPPGAFFSPDPAPIEGGQS